TPPSAPFASPSARPPPPSIVVPGLHVAVATANGSLPGLRLPGPAGWSITSVRCPTVCSDVALEQIAKAVVGVLPVPNCLPPAARAAVHDCGSVWPAVNGLPEAVLG